MNRINLPSSVFLGIIREAGQMIRQHHGRLTGKQIDRKSRHDFVTDIDREAERFLTASLARALPGSAFLTEEKTVTQAQGAYTWIIDPIDGTTNFIHGLFPVCISVALQHRGRTIWGAVYEVGAREMFMADATGAYLNGRPIRVSVQKRLDDALLATGFPYKDYDRLDAYMESFRYLMFHTSGLRRLGSAAADLVYVAAGRMDGFYEYGLNPWDVAAGAFIVQRAGGKVADFSGGDNWLFGKEILAANPHIFDNFLKVLAGLHTR